MELYHLHAVKKVDDLCDLINKIMIVQPSCIFSNSQIKGHARG